MEFEFSGSFYLSPRDEREILDLVKQGMEIPFAVEEWRCGLDDIEYFEASYVVEQIIEYIESLKKGE